MPSFLKKNRTYFLFFVILSGFLNFGFVPSHHEYKNWGLFNTQDQSHIHAPDAWSIEEGDQKVIIAVIDTGIDPDHSSLKKNLWYDQESVFGWNFVSNQSNPRDDNGHGTHIAGIIGAIEDRTKGVSGVAHHISIMSVKYYSEINNGEKNLENSIRAIHYAIDHGAHIINYSGGGPEFSRAEYLAIKKAESKGILFVAAAGNDHKNTDELENYYYPSSYHLSNIISVAATDIHNRLLSFSNWGEKTVDIAAPGEKIYSTLPHGKYGYMSGTSQATAFVTGVAALLLSKNPKLTPQEIKKIILQSADKFSQLNHKLASSGRVNAHTALKMLKEFKIHS